MDIVRRVIRWLEAAPVGTPGDIHRWLFRPRYSAPDKFDADWCISIGLTHYWEVALNAIQAWASDIELVNTWSSSVATRYQWALSETMTQYAWSVSIEQGEC